MNLDLVTNYICLFQLSVDALYYCKRRILPRCWLRTANKIR